MTDIDFDELDKAVNSALKPALEAHENDTATQADAPAEDSAPSKDEAADEKRSEPAVIIKPRTSAPMIGRERQESSVSPASKRSGRFMDMVHPSSDMASEKKVTPAPRVKIMPTENAPKPEELASEPEKKEEETAKPVVEPTPVPEAPALDIPNPDEAPEAPQAPEPEESPEELVKSDYPDPIDVAGPLSIAEEPVKDAEEAGEEEKPEPAPAEAPFLPDAKVEKRPLGGFTPEEIPDEPEAKSEDDESQLPPEAGLPAALQSDVVAVESDVLPDLLPGQADEDEEDDEREKKPKPSQEEIEKPVPMSVPHPDDGAPQSIPQQYRSEPSKTDEAPRPVFDTDQYHQPLLPAHSGKKSHVWVFILLILALLAVGGTLGYFAFMSGL